jgi:hypothetical protein
VLRQFVHFMRQGLFGSRHAPDSSASSIPQPHNRSRLTSWVAVIWLTMFLLGLSNSPFQNYLSAFIRIVGMFAGLAVVSATGTRSSETALKHAEDN